jgi:tetratricopeptide (TPR) repeat protein
MSEQQITPPTQGIQGIFSTQEVRKVGTGTTTRKTIQKSYWQVMEQKDGSIEVQPLNVNYIPSGPKKCIAKDDFLQKYAPEPEFYLANVFPKIKEMQKTVARGERYRQNKEFYSAEVEFQKALKVDEENIRANFGLGITYLERGESSKAGDILTRLVKLSDAFEDEHKHMFNEFGIKLRQNKMLDQAISYYKRAIDLASKDENLYYNIARAHLENKQPDEALDYLLKGLDINPTQEILLKFLAWLLANNLTPENKKSAAQAALLRGREGRTGTQAGDVDAGASNM